MNQVHHHDFDPTFDIAMYDTDASDLSVEAMEAAHEAVEEARAAVLGKGVLAASLPNTAPLQNAEAHNLRVLIDAIAYKSQLKTVAGTLTMALARGKITNDEYNTLEKEFALKKSSLELSAPVVKPWSPSDVLSTMPQSRIRSAQERAANDRHDLDD
jgi:hypothetical protein